MPLARFAAVSRLRNHRLPVKGGRPVLDRDDLVVLSWQAERDDPAKEQRCCRLAAWDAQPIDASALDRENSVAGRLPVAQRLRRPAKCFQQDVPR